MKQMIKIHSMILHHSKKGMHVEGLNLVIPKDYWFCGAPGYSLLKDKIYDGMILEIKGLEALGKFKVRIDIKYGHGESFESVKCYSDEEKEIYVKEIPNKEYKCVVIK